jgi:hypothetical protein
MFVCGERRVRDVDLIHERASIESQDVFFNAAFCHVFISTIGLFLNTRKEVIAIRTRDESDLVCLVSRMKKSCIC